MHRQTSRREFLTSALLVASSGVLRAADHSSGLSGAPMHASEADPTDLTAFVNVFVGTGGHGHTFPGATLPFGAVQLSPDTGVRDWDWCSGYHHDDTTLMGSATRT